MKAAALLLLALVAVLFGCGPRAEALTADAVARAANASTPILVERYAHDGRVAILSGKTDASRRAGLETVRQRWRPIWEAHGALQRAHDTWADSLESGEARGQSAVARAYCVLQSLAKDRAPLPSWPGGCPSPEASRP